MAALVEWRPEDRAPLAVGIEGPWLKYTVTFPDGTVEWYDDELSATIRFQHCPTATRMDKVRLRATVVGIDNQLERTSDGV